MADTTAALHSDELKKMFATTSKEVRDAKLAEKREVHNNYKKQMEEVKKGLKETIKKSGGDNYDALIAALSNIKSPDNVVGQLDVDLCIKEYIESECVQDGLYFLDVDDKDLLRVKGATPQTEIILKQKTHNNRNRRDFDKYEVVDDDEDDLEFLHPKKLTKEEAVRVFTGRSRIAKQFKFTGDGLDKVLNDVKQRTVIGQKTDKKLDVYVDKKLIKEVVEQLISFENSRMKGEEEKAAEEGKKKKLNKVTTEMRTKFMISPSFFLCLQVVFAKPTLTGSKPAIIPLKKPLFDVEETEMCLIVRDAHKEEFKTLLGDQFPLLKIKKLSSFYKDTKTPMKKKLFVGSYDFTFAEHEIQRAVLQRLGKYAVEKKRMPGPVALDNVEQHIKDTLSGVKIFLNSSQVDMQPKVARLNWSVSEIVNNVEDFIHNKLTLAVPYGASNQIIKIQLQTDYTPAVPIYLNLDARPQKESKTFKTELRFQSQHQTGDAGEQESEEEQDIKQPAKVVKEQKVEKQIPSEEMKVDESSKKRKRVKEVSSRYNQPSKKSKK